MGQEKRGCESTGVKNGDEDRIYEKERRKALKRKRREGDDCRRESERVN